LVTCRALLHQIAEYAPAVLPRMAAAAKPGGWLLIQEPDFHLAPTTEPEAWTRTWTGLIEWGRSNGVDWLIGGSFRAWSPLWVWGNRKPRPTCRTSAAGIAERCISNSFAEVRDRVIGAGQVDARTVDAASALLNDPNYWTQCWMMTAVLVRKPRA
jgi:hypothetical protein